MTLHRGMTIKPMEIHHGLGTIFILKKLLVNKNISSTATFTEVVEMELIDIYNDSTNRQIIINRNQADETPFDYNYSGIYSSNEDAKVGAAAVNRENLQQVREEKKELQHAMEKFNSIEKYYTEQLPQTGLI